MSLKKIYPICKLCGLKEASCKAHIIPRQFFHRMRKSSPHLFQLTAVGQAFQKGHSQSGIWEKGILCGDCDGRLGTLDSYAYSILPPLPDSLSFFPHDPWLRTYTLGNIDVDRFKRFLVSLSWRAHHATHLLFQHVDLGPYETKFHNVLLGTAPQAVLDAVSAVVESSCSLYANQT